MFVEFDYMLWVVWLFVDGVLFVFMIIMGVVFLLSGCFVDEYGSVLFLGSVGGCDVEEIIVLLYDYDFDLFFLLV